MQMRKHTVAVSGLIAALALSGLALSGAGCAGTRYERSTGAYLDDKAVSARVKTALFRDPDVSGFDVNVETFRGDVQLSGFVDTPEQKERASEIAREISGVRMVTNNLEIKPPGTGVGSSGPAVQSDTMTQPAPVRSSGQGSSMGQDQWKPISPSSSGSGTLDNRGNLNTDTTIPNQGSQAVPQSGTGADIQQQPAPDLAPLDDQGATQDLDTETPDNP
jgi:hypothetical protein